MLHTIAYANQLPQETGTPPTPPAAGISFLFPLILIFAVFYFLLILPQQRKEKTHKQMLANLKKGDKVITQSGIHGKIADIQNDIIIVEIAPKIKVEFSKSTILATLSGEKSLSAIPKEK